jgi:RHS repeat-associated protein
LIRRPGTSNLLSSLTQSSTTVRSFSYDGAGNVAADTRGSTTYNYAYNKRDRLAKLTIGSTVTADYTYDGLERLAIRTTSNMTPAGTTQYVYDLAGRLIAEADSSGNTLTEYVWLDDMPLAVVANVDTSPTLYFVHADHLNRPIRMTDGSESVVWDAVYNPFGDVNSITGSASNNLRFSGQYFLIEDGLHYNWYRHYDPTLGRYIQPDPLEFIDGASIYAYVGGNPTGFVDPTGEAGSGFPANRSLRPGYGTTSCDYYTAQCQANGGLYYCRFAPFVCSAFPNCAWSTCVRQCLQADDKKYCSHSGNGSDVACVVNIHRMCFLECPSGDVPPPSTR